MVPVFELGVCLSITLLLVDLWHYCVCCIWSGVTRCTLFMVLYPCRMCQCRLHVVLWSHIGIFMRLLAAEPCSTTWPLFHSQCPCETILLTQYSMVGDWRVSKTWPMLFYCPTARSHFVFCWFSLCLRFIIIIIKIVRQYLSVNSLVLCGYGSLDWEGVNDSLPVLHCRPLLIRIIPILYIPVMIKKQLNLQTIFIFLN